MGKKLLQRIIRIVSILLFIAFLLLSWCFFDLQTLFNQSKQLFFSFHWLLFITVCYLLAFILRAIAWRMYGDKKFPFKIYLLALFYSLFLNHIFPIKIGEVVRIGILANQKENTWDTAAHSVVVMRLLDLLCLGIFSFIGAIVIGVTLSYTFFLKLSAVLIVFGVLFLYAIRKKWSSFYRKHMTLLREQFYHKKTFPLIALVAISWVLEASVVYGVVHAIELELAFMKAIWVNSLTVASQVFQFAPGGLATYESVMSFALVQVEIDWKTAYHIALITHGYKFIFSYIVGAIAFAMHPISLSNLNLWRSKKGEAS